MQPSEGSREAREIYTYHSNEQHDDDYYFKQKKNSYEMYTRPDYWTTAMMVWTAQAEMTHTNVLNIVKS